MTDSALGRLELDDLLREMLARIRELLATDYAAILLLAEDGQSLFVRATIGLEDAVMGLRVPLGRGVAGFIAASALSGGSWAEEESVSASASAREENHRVMAGGSGGR